MEHYVNQIVELNLHKQFAVAAIPLFNRTQQIFLGFGWQRISTVRYEKEKLIKLGRKEGSCRLH